MPPHSQNLKDKTNFKVIVILFALMIHTAL